MKFFSWIKNLFKKGIRTSDADEKKLITLAKSGKIKFGTPLEVKPDFIAVLCYHNVVCDIFEEGKYRLETNIMPMLTRMQKLTRQNRRGDLPKFFKADIYYVNKRDFENFKFYSYDKVVVKDKQYKNFSARLCGTFSFHIKSPIDFLESLFTEYGLVDDDIAKREVESWIGTLATRVVQKNKPNPQALFERDTECFEGLFDGVDKGLYDCGVSLLSIEIDDVKFPKNVFKKTKFSYQEKVEPQTVQGNIEYEEKLFETPVEEIESNQTQQDMVEYKDDDLNITNQMAENDTNQMAENVTEQMVDDNQDNEDNDENEADKFKDAQVELDDTGKVINYKICPTCLSQCSEDSLMCFNCGHIFDDKR